VSNTAAHTNADEKFANWKRQNGISKIRRSAHYGAANGPKKRPMKMPATPQLFIKAFAARIELGMPRQRPDMLHAVCELEPGSNKTANRRTPRQATRDPDRQKLIPLEPISAPIATSAPQADQ